MAVPSPASSALPVTIRRATPADVPECGRICYEAFSTVAAQHNYPSDIPSAEVATGVMGALFSHPRFYCVVAESGGKIIGSNCLDERSCIAGLGPITVDPARQDRGTGNALMH